MKQAIVKYEISTLKLKNSLVNILEIEDNYATVELVQKGHEKCLVKPGTKISLSIENLDIKNDNDDCKKNDNKFSKYKNLNLKKKCKITLYRIKTKEDLSKIKLNNLEKIGTITNVCITHNKEKIKQKMLQTLKNKTI